MVVAGQPLADVFADISPLPRQFNDFAAFFSEHRQGRPHEVGAGVVILRDEVDSAYAFKFTLPFFAEIVARHAHHRDVYAAGFKGLDSP